MSQKESKSYATLEADLFLAERAFKRVPSDENQEALAKVKKAYEALQEVKGAIKAEKLTVVNTPTAPKPAVVKSVKPKAAAPAKPASKSSAATQTESDDSKKN